MERRDFLVMTAATLPVITFGQPFNFVESRAEKGFVVKANESRFNETTLLNGKSPNNIKVSSKDTNSKLTVFKYIGNEKGGPPLHYHLKQDEIFFVVEGEYTFQVGEDTYLLKPGDSLFVPRRVPHAFAQTTEKGKLFFMVQPSGKLEDFFRKISTLTGPPTPSEEAQIFADHELKVIGPPLQY